MASFDEILKDLHGEGIEVTTKDADGKITITPQRTFSIPGGYNTVLGYVGDVNSQIVTFEIPRYHEGHDLSLCSKRKLKWKNLTSGVEGNNDLTPVEGGETESSWSATWEIPPEAMTQAGTLEIAISLYDISNDIVAFSWNTATYKGFTIGETFIHTGDGWGEKALPAKDEILSIDIEGRQIVAPAGYNKIICNYGDIGTSKVFFIVNRYIRGIDIMDGAAAVYVNIAYQTTTSDWIEIPKTAITYYSQNSNKVVMCWDVPSSITNNNQRYIGNINISLKFEEKIGGQINKRWVSSSFTQLSIGPSLLIDTVTELVERDEEIVQRAADKAVDNYFDNHYFVTEP